MGCLELWDCTVLKTQLFGVSACTVWGVFCFGCLVLKYFDLSAELDCSYRVLRVRYVMGQFLETSYVKGIFVYATRIHSSTPHPTPTKHFGKVPC